MSDKSTEEPVPETEKTTEEVADFSGFDTEVPTRIATISDFDAAIIGHSIALANDHETKRMDHRLSAICSPGDLGDHKPIDEEAVFPVSCGSEDKDLEIHKKWSTSDD